MKASILIAEDDLDFQGFLTEFLTGEGYKVITANTTAQALGRLILNNIDIIITDIQIPEYKEGIQFIMQVKSLFPSLAIISMSGNQGANDLFEKEYIQLIKLAKSNTFLQKPFPPRELLRCIENGAKNV
ncbi:MAG: response regulator [Romboutsia sp.]|nr:response regulator [Romboutsia sp.]